MSPEPNPRRAAPALPDLGGLLEIPFRRPWLLILPLVLSTAAAVAAGFLVTKKYQSSTLILIETEKVPDGLAQNAVAERTRRLQTLKQEILSRTRLETVIQETDAYHQDIASGTPLTAIVDRMRNAISVKVKGNDAFAVEYVHRDPAKAMEVANRLVSLFIQESVQDRERNAAETAQFIEARLLEARHELEAKEAALRRFKEAHIGTLPEQLPANLSTLQRLQLEQQSVAADLRAAQARVATSETPAVSPRAASDEDPELARLRAELASLRTRYTDEHPDVQVLLSRIARLEAQRPAPAPRDPAPTVASSRTRTEIHVLEEKQAELSRRVSSFESRVEETPRTEQELAVLSRDYEKLKDSYLALLNKKMGARMAENLEKEWKGEQFRILDPAHLPERPFYPNRLLFLLAGIGAGLATGIALVTAAELLDPSVKALTELETLLPAIPVLASIPHIDVGRLSREATAGPTWAVPPSSSKPLPPRERPETPAAPDAPPGDASTEPEPVVAHEPEPVVAPEPEPVAAHEPEPVAAHEPEPVAAPEPEPVAAPEPEPVVAHEPEPVVAPEPEPVAAPEPEPVAAPEPEPVAAPEPEPVAAPEPEPVAAREPEPVVAPEPEPVVAHEPEPVVAHEPEPVVAHEPEPVVAHEPEPVVAHEPEPEPFVPEEPEETFVLRAPAPPIAAYRATTPSVDEEPPAPILQAETASETLTVARLTADGGHLHGLSLAMRAGVEYSIGQSTACDFRLDIANVSALHAHVVAHSRGVFLSDAGSARGTFVNGRRVDSAHPIRPGDEIFLGAPGTRQSALLVLDVDAAALAAATATQAPAPSTAPTPAAPATPPVAAPPVAPAKSERPPAPALSAPHAPPVVESSAPVRPAPPLSAAASATPAPTARPSSPPPAIRAPQGVTIPPIRPVSPPARKEVARSRSLVPWLRIAAVLAGLGLATALAARLMPRGAPVVSGVTPFRAEPGQTVTVSGQNLGSGNAVVRFGAQPAEVTFASASQLTVTVPRMANAQVPVIVELGGRKSAPVVFQVAAVAHIAALEPSVALPGSEIVARGDDLAGTAPLVYVAGTPARILSAEPEQIRFQVPPGLLFTEGVEAPVTVRVGEDVATASLVLGHLPLVRSVQPAEGVVGTRVVIHGVGFAPEPGRNVVTFNDSEALVFAATPTEITVAAPFTGAGAAQTEIRVTVNGTRSASQADFRIDRPAATTFVPRFYPAAVPGHAGHDHAFVATELGPVLLLTGPEDGLSAAERAARASRALNTLVDTAAKPLVVEARGGDHPAVALAGGGAVIASVTPNDAATYAEFALKGARVPPPGALAAFWAALLKDQLALFVHHERPTHVLELTSRGRGFLDLYESAAHGAGPGNGVPTDLVIPLSSSVAESLRNTALQAPPDGEPTAGAAVAGRWLGTMEEGEEGALPIDVRLRLENDRLKGTLSLAARPGTPALLDTQLQSPSYARGAIRFTAVVKGRPLLFAGSLKDDALVGSISTINPTKPVGYFSVRYSDQP